MNRRHWSVAVHSGSTIGWGSKWRILGYREICSPMITIASVTVKIVLSNGWRSKASTPTSFQRLRMWYDRFHSKLIELWQINDSTVESVVLRRPSLGVDDVSPAALRRSRSLRNGELPPRWLSTVAASQLPWWTVRFIHLTSDHWVS